jgi:GNAT superfamily N-acetyltransferase
MAPVLQLCKSLAARPESLSISGVAVRTFATDDDIAAFLDLRHRAFARQRVGVRQWTSDDFLQEFVNHWWWQPARMWFAEQESDIAAGGPKQLVGSATLAMRGEPDSARPVVHWLMVLPTARRRGIGRLLMAHVERAAWDAGYREVYLETHAQWLAAVQFYESLGYTAHAHKTD